MGLVRAYFRLVYYNKINFVFLIHFSRWSYFGPSVWLVCLVHSTWYIWCLSEQIPRYVISWSLIQLRWILVIYLIGKFFFFFFFFCVCVSFVRGKENKYEVCLLAHVVKITSLLLVYTPLSKQSQRMYHNYITCYWINTLLQTLKNLFCNKPRFVFMKKKLFLFFWHVRWLCRISDIFPGWLCYWE